MKKYLLAYRKYIKRIIESNADGDYNAVLSELEKQVEFFQHERLIHLIVTALFSVLLFISLFIVLVTHFLPIIFMIILLLILLIPYIMHYYFLENEVQGLYEDYNQLFYKINGLGYNGSLLTEEQEKK